MNDRDRLAAACSKLKAGNLERLQNMINWTCEAFDKPECYVSASFDNKDRAQAVIMAIEAAMTMLGNALDVVEQEKGDIR